MSNAITCNRQAYFTRDFVVNAVLAIILALSFSSSYAQDQQQQDYADALAVVSQLMSSLKAEVQSHMLSGDLSGESMQRIVGESVLPFVDIPLFARLVLGGYYRNFSAEQRQETTEAIRTSLSEAYGKSLLFFGDVEKFQYAPYTPDRIHMRNKFSTVSIGADIFMKVGGKPKHIEYVLSNREGKWLVFDLVFEGIGLVRQLHDTYSRTLSDVGIDGFINKLRQF